MKVSLDVQVKGTGSMSIFLAKSYGKHGSVYSDDLLGHFPTMWGLIIKKILQKILSFPVETVI